MDGPRYLASASQSRRIRRSNNHRLVIGSCPGDRPLRNSSWASPLLLEECGDAGSGFGFEADSRIASSGSVWDSPKSEEYLSACSGTYGSSESAGEENVSRTTAAGPRPRRSSSALRGSSAELPVVYSLSPPDDPARGQRQVSAPERLLAGFSREMLPSSLRHPLVPDPCFALRSLPQLNSGSGAHWSPEESALLHHAEVTPAGAPLFSSDLRPLGLKGWEATHEHRSASYGEEAGIGWEASPGLGCFCPCAGTPQFQRGSGAARQLSEPGTSAFKKAVNTFVAVGFPAAFPTSSDLDRPVSPFHRSQPDSLEGMSAQMPQSETYPTWQHSEEEACAAGGVEGGNGFDGSDAGRRSTSWSPAFGESPRRHPLAASKSADRLPFLDALDLHAQGLSMRCVEQRNGTPEQRLSHLTTQQGVNLETASDAPDETPASEADTLELAPNRFVLDYGSCSSCCSCTNGCSESSCSSICIGRNCSCSCSSSSCSRRRRRGGSSRSSTSSRRRRARSGRRCSSEHRCSGSGGWAGEQHCTQVDAAEGDAASMGGATEETCMDDNSEPINCAERTACLGGSSSGDGNSGNSSSIFEEGGDDSVCEADADTNGSIDSSSSPTEQAPLNNCASLGEEDDCTATVHRHAGEGLSGALAHSDAGAGQVGASVAHESFISADEDRSLDVQAEAGTEEWSAESCPETSGDASGEASGPAGPLVAECITNEAPQTGPEAQQLGCSSGAEGNGEHVETETAAKQAPSASAHAAKELERELTERPQEADVTPRLCAKQKGRGGGSVRKGGMLEAFFDAADRKKGASAQKAARKGSKGPAPASAELPEGEALAENLQAVVGPRKELPEPENLVSWQPQSVPEPLSQARGASDHLQDAIENPAKEVGAFGALWQGTALSGGPLTPPSSATPPEPHREVLHSSRQTSNHEKLEGPAGRASRQSSADDAMERTSLLGFPAQDLGDNDTLQDAPEDLARQPATFGTAGPSRQTSLSEPRKFPFCSMQQKPQPAGLRSNSRQTSNGETLVESAGRASWQSSAGDAVERRSLVGPPAQEDGNGDLFQDPPEELLEQLRACEAVGPPRQCSSSEPPPFPICATNPEPERQRSRSSSRQTSSREKLESPAGPASRQPSAHDAVDMRSLLGPPAEEDEESKMFQDAPEDLVEQRVACEAAGPGGRSSWEPPPSPFCASQPEPQPERLSSSSRQTSSREKLGGPMGRASRQSSDHDPVERRSLVGPPAQEDGDGDLLQDPPEELLEQLRACEAVEPQRQCSSSEPPSLPFCSTQPKPEPEGPRSSSRQTSSREKLESRTGLASRQSSEHDAVERRSLRGPSSAQGDEDSDSFEDAAEDSIGEQAAFEALRPGDATPSEAATVPLYAFSPKTQQECHGGCDTGVDHKESRQSSLPEAAKTPCLSALPAHAPGESDSLEDGSESSIEDREAVAEGERRQSPSSEPAAPLDVAPPAVPHSRRASSRQTSHDDQLGLVDFQRPRRSSLSDEPPSPVHSAQRRNKPSRGSSGDTAEGQDTQAFSMPETIETPSIFARAEGDSDNFQDAAEGSAEDYAPGEAMYNGATSPFERRSASFDFPRQMQPGDSLSYRRQASCRDQSDSQAKQAFRQLGQLRMSLPRSMQAQRQPEGSQANGSSQDNGSHTAAREPRDGQPDVTETAGTSPVNSESAGGRDSGTSRSDTQSDAPSRATTHRGSRGGSRDGSSDKGSGSGGNSRGRSNSSNSSSRGGGGSHSGNGSSRSESDDSRSKSESSSSDSDSSKRSSSSRSDTSSLIRESSVYEKWSSCMEFSNIIRVPSSITEMVTEGAVESGISPACVSVSSGDTPEANTGSEERRGSPREQEVAKLGPPEAGTADARGTSVNTAQGGGGASTADQPEQAHVSQRAPPAHSSTGPPAVEPLAGPLLPEPPAAATRPPPTFGFAAALSSLAQLVFAPRPPISQGSHAASFQTAPQRMASGDASPRDAAEQGKRREGPPIPPAALAMLPTCDSEERQKATIVQPHPPDLAGGLGVHLVAAHSAEGGGRAQASERRTSDKEHGIGEYGDRGFPRPSDQVEQHRQASTTYMEEASMNIILRARISAEESKTRSERPAPQSAPTTQGFIDVKEADRNLFESARPSPERHEAPLEGVSETNSDETSHMSSDRTQVDSGSDEIAPPAHEEPESHQEGTSGSRSEARSQSASDSRVGDEPFSSSVTVSSGSSGSQSQGASDSSSEERSQSSVDTRGDYNELARSQRPPLVDANKDIKRPERGLAEEAPSTERDERSDENCTSPSPSIPGLASRQASHYQTEPFAGQGRASEPPGGRRYRGILREPLVKDPWEGETKRPGVGECQPAMVLPFAKVGGTSLKRSRSVIWQAPRSPMSFLARIPSEPALPPPPVPRKDMPNPLDISTANRILDSAIELALHKRPSEQEGRGAGLRLRRAKMGLLWGGPERGGASKATALGPPAPTTGFSLEGPHASVSFKQETTTKRLALQQPALACSLPSIFCGSCLSDSSLWNLQLRRRLSPAEKSLRTPSCHQALREEDLRRGPSIQGEERGSIQVNPPRAVARGPKQREPAQRPVKPGLSLGPLLSEVLDTPLVDLAPRVVPKAEDTGGSSIETASLVAGRETGAFRVHKMPKPRRPWACGEPISVAQEEPKPAYRTYVHKPGCRCSLCLTGWGASGSPGVPAGTSAERYGEGYPSHELSSPRLQGGLPVVPVQPGPFVATSPVRLLSSPITPHPGYGMNVGGCVRFDSPGGVPYGAHGNAVARGYYNSKANSAAMHATQPFYPHQEIRSPRMQMGSEWQPAHYPPAADPMTGPPFAGYPLVAEDSQHEPSQPCGTPAFAASPPPHTPVNEGVPSKQLSSGDPPRGVSSEELEKIRMQQQQQQEQQEELKRKQEELEQQQNKQREELEMEKQLLKEQREGLEKQRELLEQEKQNILQARLQATSRGRYRRLENSFDVGMGTAERLPVGGAEGDFELSRPGTPRTQPGPPLRHTTSTSNIVRSITGGGLGEIQPDFRHGGAGVEPDGMEEKEAWSAPGSRHQNLQHPVAGSRLFSRTASVDTMEDKETSTRNRYGG